MGTADGRSFPRVVRSARVNGSQVSADASRDPRRGVLDGIPSKVSIPQGSLKLRVTEQLPNHREALAQGPHSRSVRVAKMVGTDWVAGKHECSKD